MSKIKKFFKYSSIESLKFTSSFSVGLAKSIIDLSSDAAYGIRANKIQNNLLKKLKKQSYKAELKKLKFKQQYPYSDACIISGLTAFEMQQNGVSPDVETAYELAYPNLASESSFLHSWNSFEDYEQRLGFVSGIKGKLFEIKYVDHMNETLEDGYYAEMASSANQAGWDISIKGPDAEVVNLIQLKATDSLNYVKSAIEKYPDIDVVTLSDFQGQLATTSYEIGTSEISNSDLINEINSSIDGQGELLFPLALPSLGVSWVAFQSYKEKDLNAFRKHYKFGKRTGNIFLNIGILSSFSPFIGIPFIFMKESYLNKSRNQKKINKFLQSQLSKAKETEDFWDKRVSRKDFLKGLGLGVASIGLKTAR